MRRTLLYVGGAISILFAVLHILFWTLLDWPAELAGLNADNRALMQMLNVAVAYFFLFGGGIAFYLGLRAREFGFLEKAILGFVAGLYILRTAFGYPFFGYSTVELGVWLTCIAAALCYLVALRPGFNPR